MHDLYTKLSPDAAAAVTQIILRDLRPILYPVQEIHYSSALLDYNTKSLTTISLWDFMKYWDPTGRLGKAFRLLGSLESAAESFENPEIKLAPQIGHLIAVNLFLSVSTRPIHLFSHLWCCRYQNVSRAKAAPTLSSFLSVPTRFGPKRNTTENALRFMSRLSTRRRLTRGSPSLAKARETRL